MDPVYRTRMLSPSSAPPSQSQSKRTRDKEALDKEHRLEMIRAFIDFCYWHTLAPLTFSRQKPPVNIALRFGKETAGPDLFTATHRDQEGISIVWTPGGETREHVFLGSVRASSHPACRVRFDIGADTPISAERAWTRAIRRAWQAQHKDTGGGGQGDGYVEFVPAPELRLHHDDALNTAARAEILKRIKLMMKPDADLTVFWFGNVFRLIAQWHYVEEEVDEYQMCAPGECEMPGGEPGGDDLVIRTGTDGVLEIRVWVNTLASGDKPREVKRPPTELEVTDFFSVYLNMLFARFALYVMRVGDGNDNDSDKERDMAK